MADSKYGNIFTEGEVRQIVQECAEQGWGSESELDEFLSGFRRKFPPEEPTFTLRARDRRALGAVRFYADNQSLNAPQNHLAGVDRAVSDFEAYRRNNPGEMKEPD